MEKHGAAVTGGIGSAISNNTNGDSEYMLNGTLYGGVNGHG